MARDAPSPSSHAPLKGHTTEAGEDGLTSASRRSAILSIG